MKDNHLRNFQASPPYSSCHPIICSTLGLLRHTQQEPYAFVLFELESNIVQLEIPADAKRSSATTMKCRCDKAKVVSITSLDGKKEHSSVENKEYNPHITYKVGEMVYPDSFDDNRWDECSHGIHFFINKQDAINY